MIYAMQPVDGGPIKLGHTKNVEKRRLELETHYGRRLAVLFVMEGGRREERELHARFSHVRIGRTEQFLPSPDLMEFIGKPMLAQVYPQAIEAMEPTRTATNIRARPEWKSWLDRFADNEKIDTSDLVDTALLLYARSRGFEMPPER